MIYFRAYLIGIAVGVVVGWLVLPFERWLVKKEGP